MLRTMWSQMIVAPEFVQMSPHTHSATSTKELVSTSVLQGNGSFLTRFLTLPWTPPTFRLRVVGIQFATAKVWQITVVLLRCTAQICLQDPRAHLPSCWEWGCWQFKAERVFLPRPRRAASPEVVLSNKGGGHPLFHDRILWRVTIHGPIDSV